MPTTAPGRQRRPKTRHTTPVFAGVDTHKDLHVAAVIDASETVLGTRSFSTTRAGYRAMLAWIAQFGELVRIGIEGTGSYGAGLTRHLATAGVTILEVDRPDRSDRRRKGKDDDLDAISAARAALHQRRTVTPKSKDGAVEALRVLRVARAHAVRERRSTLQSFAAEAAAPLPDPPSPGQMYRALLRLQAGRET
jgi:transposase